MSLAAITERNLPDRGEGSSLASIRGPRLPLSMAASALIHLALFSGVLIWFSPEGGMSEMGDKISAAHASGPIEISLVAWSPPKAEVAAMHERQEMPKPKAVPKTPDPVVTKRAAFKKVDPPVQTSTPSPSLDVTPATVDPASASLAGKGTEAGGGLTAGAGDDAGAGASASASAQAGTSDVPVYVSDPKFRSPPRPPTYPLRAQRLGQHGEALIRARLDRRGTPADVQLWKSTGHVLLDNAALAAVRRWQFEPARRQGVPVEGWVQIPVRFALKN